MAECSLAKTMRQLPAAEADQLVQWSESGLDTNGNRVSAQRVADALKADGTPVRVSTVRAHRRGACRCVTGAETP